MKSTKKELILNRVIFVLAIVGIIIAAYVTQSFIRKSPIVCVNSGCELVRKNPASYILGIPVPAFGLIGYSLMALFAFLRTSTIEKSQLLLKGILGIATFGVVFVSWFTYTEITVIKALCTWCGVSAINMLVIFLLSIKSIRLSKVHG
jgi:uncharacterized membrane protein